MTEPEVTWPKELTDAWVKGSWTPEKVNLLEQQADDHVDNCDDCQKLIERCPIANCPCGGDDVIGDDEPYFCPIGESLQDTSTQAMVEYSWQPDFNPNWNKKGLE